MGINNIHLPKSQILRIFSLQNIIFFICLFVLYSFRNVHDITTPYLWAEDGAVLIQRTMTDGLGSLFMPGNGFFWTIQQMIAIVCFYILMPLGKLIFLPQMMSIVAKSIAVISLLYFTSDRFEWILKHKIARFFTCMGIILLIPNQAFDVITCDTSLPFFIFFPIFLMGLSYLFTDEYAMPNIKQALFMALMCLSHAAAPVIVAVIGLADIRWLVTRLKGKNFEIREFLRHLLNLSIVCIAAIIQVVTILSSSKLNVELDLFRRMVAVTRSMFLIPGTARIIIFSIPMLLLLSIVILAFVLISHTSIKFFLYCVIFNWFFLLFCSLSVTVDTWYKCDCPRYMFLYYQVEALFIFVVLFKLINFKDVRQSLAGALSVAIIMGLICQGYTYYVILHGNEYTSLYNENIDYFSKNGNETMYVPIPPVSAWYLIMPISLPKTDNESSLTIELLEITNDTGVEPDKTVRRMRFSAVSDEKVNISQILLEKEGVCYPSRNMDDGSFTFEFSPFMSKKELEFDIIWKDTNNNFYKTKHLFTEEQLKKLEELS